MLVGGRGGGGKIAAGVCAKKGKKSFQMEKVLLKKRSTSPQKAKMTGVKESQRGEKKRNNPEFGAITFQEGFQSSALMGGGKKGPNHLWENI